MEPVEEDDEVAQFFWSDEERVEFVSDVSAHPVQRKRWAERAPRNVRPTMHRPAGKGASKRGGRPGRAAARRREPTPDEIYEQVRREARARWSGYGGSKGRDGRGMHIVRGVAPTGNDTLAATSSWEKGGADRVLRAGGIMFVLLILLMLYIFIIKGGLL